MPNADEILFSKKGHVKYNDALFNTDINWDTDSVSIHVSYAFLLKDKTLGKDNIVYSDDPLIVVGFCIETDKFNVCSTAMNSKIFFWVDKAEISEIQTSLEHWPIEEVRLHHKSINEKWMTIKTNTTKELSKNKTKLKKRELKGNKK